jgi:hypothetical protein
MASYEFRLYKQGASKLPLHPHVQTINIEADSDQAAEAEARLVDVGDADSAMLFEDGRQIGSLWTFRDA